MFTFISRKKIMSALTRLERLNQERATLYEEMFTHVTAMEERMSDFVDANTVDEMVTSRVEDAVDTDDITEEITSSYTFTSAVETAVDDQLNGMSMEDMGVDIDTLVADALSEAVEDGSLLTLIASKLAVTVADETETEEVPA